MVHIALYCTLLQQTHSTLYWHLNSNSAHKLWALLLDSANKWNCILQSSCIGLGAMQAGTRLFLMLIQTMLTDGLLTQVTTCVLILAPHVLAS